MTSISGAHRLAWSNDDFAVEEEKLNSGWDNIDDGLYNHNSSNAPSSAAITNHSKTTAVPGKNKIGNFTEGNTLPPTPLAHPKLLFGGRGGGGVSSTPRISVSTPVSTIGTPLATETGDNDFEEIMREKNRVGDSRVHLIVYFDDFVEDPSMNVWSNI
jgi:hypothetical protein